MAISQAITVVFKQDLMSPSSNLEAATLKCALYDNTATLNQNTSAYATANEISSSGTKLYNRWCYFKPTLLLQLMELQQSLIAITLHLLMQLFQHKLL
jgi:hypothetical protein